jgi:chaperonin GroES
MIRGDKEIYVVADRVLIRIDDMEERTAVGLYLPPTALEREDVQSGRIEEVGPGFPLPPKSDDDNALWEGEAGDSMRYIGLQAKKGDHAIFLRKDAIEIKFDDEKFLVVPQAAIMVLVRDIA